MSVMRGIVIVIVCVYNRVLKTCCENNCVDLITNTTTTTLNLFFQIVLS